MERAQLRSGNGGRIVPAHSFRSSLPPRGPLSPLTLRSSDAVSAFAAAASVSASTASACGTAGVCSPSPLRKNASTAGRVPAHAGSAGAAGRRGPPSPTRCRRFKSASARAEHPGDTSEGSNKGAGAVRPYTRCGCITGAQPKSARRCAVASKRQKTFVAAVTTLQRPSRGVAPGVATAAAEGRDTSRRSALWGVSRGGTPTRSGTGRAPLSMQLWTAPEPARTTRRSGDKWRRMLLVL